MSAVATTLAQAGDSDWPFVTLPNFNDWTGAPWVPFNISLAIIVEPHLRYAWKNFSMTNAADWIEETLPHSLVPSRTSTTLVDDGNITHDIWTYGPDGTKVVDPVVTAAVSWQTTTPDVNEINYNRLRLPIFSKAFLELREYGRPLLAQLVDGASIMFQPVFRNLKPTIVRRDLVGFLYTEVPWEQYFGHVLQENVRGIHVVVEDTCGGSVTLVIRGTHAFVLGPGDLHHEEFDDFIMEDDLDLSNLLGHPATISGCKYKLQVYPSMEYRSAFEIENVQALSSFPISIALVIILAGAFVFLVYDWFVRRKQAAILKSAKQSLALVNSLFPATIRDRIFDKDHDVCNVSIAEDVKKKAAEDQGAAHIPKPIADLFPETTIMFADIVGFTAWSSVRDPPQVFTLLENIFDTFDQVAKRRGVFKVETIGDCYVAVSGLPTPRRDHAVVMACFARRCQEKMLSIVSELETLLGPGTGDLGMRFGLHSGPVMAGVLRGDKSRFQLFGDTMNTASRIEATGAKNHIHLSEQTAALIAQAGRESWLLKREDLVSAKGKGMLQTFWLDLTASRTRVAENRLASTRSLMSKSMSVTSFGQDSTCTTNEKPSIFTRKNSMGRLIDYNVQVLASLLKKIMAMDPSRPQGLDDSFVPMFEDSSSMVLDEVAEVIVLPSEPAKYSKDPEAIELPPEVDDQLRHYVSWVASLYHDHPFHSFDHASHVTMSVTKLLARVVTPQAIDYQRMEYKTKAKSSQLHEYTFGITSDPLTQFAVAFSALIHDIDHQGVPNSQLVKEGAAIAEKYRNQSVAEQNSVDLAWNMLLHPRYQELRRCIYGTQEELGRFRQLVVNVVMATDIVDKNLGAIRKRRWDTVFDTSVHECMSEQESTNRKATVVIEHLMQASDVSHTMQHWHIYLKWNKRLFEEMYLAYKTGRSSTDPSENWYAGELGFFDHYIIPLAKKLKECGVFGVSGDEYMAYAEANREEWARKGHVVVQEYLTEFNAKSTSAAAAAAASASRLHA
jgi:class 3 adenylate cyclase